MATVKLVFPDDQSVSLECRELRGVERLGERTTFSLLARGKDPVASTSVLNKGCVIEIATPYGGRVIRGIVTRFSAVAIADHDALRTYRIEVSSSIARLALSRRCRVFQHMTVPDIVKATLKAAGWDDDQITVQLGGAHEKREYLVQYEENDESFIRRICEDEGLYYRFSAGDAGDVFALYDTSTAMKSTLPESILIVDDTGLHHQGLTAWQISNVLSRRAGKVTLRDYDRKNPALKLEGVSQAGTDVEKGTEVYLAPGKFRSPAAGNARAQLELEARRAEARTVRLETNAISAAPGDAVQLATSSGYHGAHDLDGSYFVVAMSHEFRFDEEAGYHLFAALVPSEVPYRLPKTTPRPRIAGIHSALVTGAAGEEIHPDADGCIFVRFRWDRIGPQDDKSSLPVRVAQPNMPGSMATPRVGWEVFVTFEDGDPDRPYVIGRTYNGKEVPPHPLPANKTMTSMSTLSSPGGHAKNAVSFDDRAGGQHMMWHAGFGKSVSVANDHNIRVGNVEGEQIKGSQSRTVSGKEDVSVAQAMVVTAASQTASIGAMQNHYVSGDVSVKVGSETVAIGAALLEKVGNPVKGAINLAVSAGIAGVGAVGAEIGGLAAKAAPFVGAAAGIGYGMYQAATAPGAGPNAARDAGIRGLMGAVAGHVPGGDALFASVGSTGAKFPWEKPPPPSGAAAPGGGAGAAMSDASAAAGPGPGHRATIVKGAMAEAIGSSNIVVTPGSIMWQTTGAELIGVGASHSTKCVSAGAKTLGASNESLGSFHITTAGESVRDVKGPVSTSISGALKSTAGGQHSISGGSSVTIKAGGGMTLTGGSVVFLVGGTVLASSPGGILIKADSITITGKSTQSGKASHQ
jgi:type VI secretion system secreted protein VgrG